MELRMNDLVSAGALHWLVFNGEQIVLEASVAGHRVHVHPQSEDDAEDFMSAAVAGSFALDLRWLAICINPSCPYVYTSPREETPDGETIPRTSAESRPANSQVITFDNATASWRPELDLNAPERRR